MSSSGTRTLWDSVEKTDPSITKKVNSRGGFTAVDAYHQIKNATEMFGPVGLGWGWEVQHCDISDGERGPFVSMQITMWYLYPYNHPDIARDGEPPLLNRRCSYDVFGAADLGRSPHEAHKKALTDAITKGLSYIGFNADIFLGKFDDNKYVEERKKEVIQEARARDVPTPEELKNQLKGIEVMVNNAKSIDELKSVRARSKLTLSYAMPEQHDHLKAAMKAKAEELTPG